jgi:hypothetical protein
MSDTNHDAVEQGLASEMENPMTHHTPTEDGNDETGEAGGHFSERYGEILGNINETLDSVDWNQMGRIGKAAGVIIAVIVVQVLIKGVLDTINLIPVVPGLLELLGLVVVGQWSWQNLSTSDKRSAVLNRIQALRKEYLG